MTCDAHRNCKIDSFMVAGRGSSLRRTSFRTADLGHHWQHLDHREVRKLNQDPHEINFTAYSRPATRVCG